MLAGLKKGTLDVLTGTRGLFRCDSLLFGDAWGNWVDAIDGAIHAPPLWRTST